MNIEHARKVLSGVTAYALETNLSRCYSWGVRKSEIDGIIIFWRYLKQIAQNEFSPLSGKEGATHISIEHVLGMGELFTKRKIEI